MTDQSNTEPGFPLRLTRLINAPVDLVYKAWTQHLAEWFAPRPLTTHLQEVDMRPGGRFRFTMKDPNGPEYPCDGVFLDVVPNRRIVSTDAFLPGWVPSGKPFMVAVTTFETEGDKTRYTATAMHWSEADRKAHEEMGFHPGWNQVADQLEELVARLKG